MTKKLTMPEELGGTVYEIRVRLPKKYKKQIFALTKPYVIYVKDKNGNRKLDGEGNPIVDQQATQDNTPGDVINEINDLGLKTMIIRPDNLDLDEIDDLEYDILFDYINPIIQEQIDDKRRAEIQKKVVLR